MDEVKIRLDSRIDEHTLIPAHPQAPAIRLDMKSVKGINSMGVRTFLRWTELHKDVPLITLENCPSSIINAINFLAGFLKPNMKVESFFVPYYSEATGENAEYLFVVKRDYLGPNKYNLPEMKDSSGELMDPDMDIDAYLKFLSRTS